MDNLSKYRELADELQGKRSYAVRKLKEEKKALRLIKQRVKDCEEARKYIQTIAEQTQKTVHDRIASIVTKCLQAVFGEEAYRFEIDFKQSRGKTEARLVFVRDRHKLEDPIDEIGGGCIDIAVLAIRPTVIRMSKPALRPCLILDEPLRNLSDKYRHLVPSLFETLANDLGIQIIYSTNFKEYECGKVIKIGEQNV